MFGGLYLGCIKTKLKVTEEVSSRPSEKERGEKWIFRIDAGEIDVRMKDVLGCVDADFRN